jgi:hypothetical protein
MRLTALLFDPPRRAPYPLPEGTVPYGTPEFSLKKKYPLLKVPYHTVLLNQANAQRTNNYWQQ